MSKRMAHDLQAAERLVSEMNRHLVEKGEVFLRVKVDSDEAAAQLWEWLYRDEDARPMKAQLQELSWDAELVPHELVEKLAPLIHYIQHGRDRLPTLDISKADKPPEPVRRGSVPGMRRGRG